MEVLAQQLPIAGMTQEEPVDFMIGEPMATAEAEYGLRDRILNSRVGRAATAFITALGIGASAELAIASAAGADQAPVAHEASGGWTVLGGDPLVSGGIHSRHDFVRLITSTKGKDAMQLEGLSAKEIAAVDQAAHQGKETTCSMPYGETFKAMVFGINGASIDHNVTFLDPRYKGNPAPAYCLDAPVRDKHGKVTEVVHMKAPDLCANLSLVNRTYPKPAPKPHHKHQKPPTPHTPVTPPTPPTPAVNCSGNTTNTAIGNTGVQSGNCSVNTPVTVCSPVNSPNSVVCSTPPETPPVTPPVTPPSTPSIEIQKTLIESFNPDGTPYSTIVTKHGNTDEWQVTVQNDGNVSLSDAYTDNPPAGEIGIDFASQPFGLQIDASGNSTWGDTLNPGDSVTYYVETQNQAMPCYVNEQNTVTVVGTDSAGQQVEKQAQAPIKEDNTTDCNQGPPTGGSGQPVPTS